MGLELTQRSIEPWEMAAIEDLEEIRPTPFRQFLWRYGSDIRNGRERFRFLSELYRVTRVPVLANGSLFATLSMAGDVLPEPDDGVTLKQDLVSCGSSPYSLLPPGDPLDTIAFFMDHSELRAFPSLPSYTVRVDHDLLENRKDEVLDIAERAAGSSSEWSRALLSSLASLFDPKNFLSLTQQRPRLRQALISVNPGLLNSNDLVHVPAGELLHLLELVPPASDEFLLPRILRVDDESIAAFIYGRSPYLTLRAVIAAMEGESQGSHGLVGSAWLRAISKDRSKFFSSGILGEVHSTNALARLAALLGHDSSEVLRNGSSSWVLALNSARDDVHGRDRQIFLAFLLAVALDAPRVGCESLFERAFESVYIDLLHSRLSYEATSILSRHLPSLPWWQQWDSCLRLRLGVVQAYIASGLDRRSFLRLTKDSKLIVKLIELAKGGLE